MNTAMIWMGFILLLLAMIAVAARLAVTYGGVTNATVVKTASLSVI